jgi:predicted MFS family arabinose efflux permease
LMLILPRASSSVAAVIATLAALGVISGQPAGPVMSLPAQVLKPATRAIGMGIFYTLYYGSMMLGPVVGGAFAKWSGSAAAAFGFGALVLVACPVLLWSFNRVAQPRAKGP